MEGASAGFGLSFSKSLPGREKESQLIPWLSRQLTSLPKPVAVFSEYDDFAVEVLNACDSSRTPVPEQLAVLGVGDDPLRCEFAPVPLSSIDDDEEVIGYEAAALLGRLMNNERPPTNPILIPPAPITTASAPISWPSSTPLVASALRRSGLILPNRSEQTDRRHRPDVLSTLARRLHQAHRPLNCG